MTKRVAKLEVMAAEPNPEAAMKIASVKQTLSLDYMEQLLEILDSLGSLLTGGGLGVLTFLFFYDFRRRSEAAKAKQDEAAARAAEEDNITSYAAEWKDLYEKKEARVEKLEAQVDEDRQRIRELMEENTRLKLDGVTYRCEKLDCGVRIPPNAYTPKNYKWKEV